MDSSTPSNAAQALAALRGFLRWSGVLGAHHLPGDAWREALRAPRVHVERPYTPASEAEVAALMTAATTARDRALLGVMLGGGLRVSEVSGLDVSDVLENVSGGAALYVRQGKGRKDRTVPVRAEVLTMIRSYLVETSRTLGEPGPLFRAHDRGAQADART